MITWGRLHINVHLQFMQPTFLPLRLYKGCPTLLIRLSCVPERNTCRRCSVIWQYSTELFVVKMQIHHYLTESIRYPLRKLKWFFFFFCHLLLYISLSNCGRCILVLCVHAVCICMCFLFTVQRRWRSFVTWTWATDHSRCPSGRGRTLGAGCGRGS